MKFYGIAQRIILSVVPVITISTVLFIFVIHAVTDMRIHEQINARMRKDLGVTRLEIQKELTRTAVIARSLAVYAEINGHSPAEKEEAREFLERVNLSNPNTLGCGLLYEPYARDKDEYASGVYVYKAEGQVVYEGDYGRRVNYFNQPWYMQGRKSPGDVVWSGVYYDSVPRQALITAAAPFFDRRGNIRGVAAAAMSLETIREIVETISRDKTGETFVLGARGEYISYFDDSRTLRDSILNDRDPNLAFLGGQALSAGDGMTVLKKNGLPREAYFTTVPETRWTLVIMLDEKETAYSTWGMVMPMAVFPFAGVILAMISILLTAAHLRSIANKVNNFADLIASGNFEERIDITEVDEFGVMEKHLNTMAREMGAMHRNMQETLRTAQVASRAKSDFLSNMSHEIRTPLNAIIGMTAIAKKTGDAGKTACCLEKIDNASTHLLGVINDILDMSKIEANKLELSAEEFNIEKMIQRVIGVISFRVEEKKQNLEVRIGPDIPRFLIGDDQRLAQIITNLLANAVKFTPPEGSIRLEARLVKKEDRRCVLQFEVSDTGIGVPPEKQAGLFDSFAQADSGISRKFGGTGLGLAISKRIVEMMKGRIWLTSEAGKGSVFSFTIEAEAGKTEAPARPGPEPRPPGGETGEPRDDFSGRRALLVEDVEINREVAMSLLEPVRLNFDIAENGAEAVRIVQAAPEPYDLIFMDVHMPEMDGYEAARRIRKLEGPGRHTPIVAMTANVFREDIEKCLAAGMDDHVGKPIDLEEVHRILRKYLG